MLELVARSGSEEAKEGRAPGGARTGDPPGEG